VVGLLLNFAGGCAGLSGWEYMRSVPTLLPPQRNPPLSPAMAEVMTKTPGLKRPRTVNGGDAAGRTRQLSPGAHP